MLQRMLEIADRGVAANFMSTYVDYQQPEGHHSDPADIFRFLMSLTSRVVLRHDHLQYHFTVYAYRSPGSPADIESPAT